MKLVERLLRVKNLSSGTFIQFEILHATMRLDKGGIFDTALWFHLVVFILHSNFTQYHRFTLSLGKPKMPIGHFHHASLSMVV